MPALLLGTCRWAVAAQAGGRGRIPRQPPLVRAARDAAAATEAQELLQRSLDLGPAVKQAPDFEYVAVAFRSQPRAARRRHRSRSRGSGSDGEASRSKIFGDTPPQEAAGYRSLEVVSGDRRLLFEEPPHQAKRGPPGAAAGTERSGAARVQPVAAAEPLAAEPSVAVPPAAAAGRAAVRPPHQKPARKSTPLTERGSLGKPMPTPTVPDAAASARGGSAASSAARSAASSAVNSRGSAARGGQAPIKQHPNRQSEEAASVGHSPAAAVAATRAAATPSGRPHRSPAAEFEVAAASLLGMPCAQLRRQRLNLHRELMALHAAAADAEGGHCASAGGGGGGVGGGGSAALLGEVVGALRRGLGLEAAQVVGLLVAQPRLLRETPRALEARAAALASQLRLRPGDGRLAGVALAAPDVLLRRGGYAGAAAALAAALAPAAALRCEEDAAALLLAHPRLLCLPAAFYGQTVALLRSELDLPDEAAAAAMAAAEPRLLTAPPGVIAANAAALRRRLQLSRAAVGAVVAQRPELLARPPGALAAVVGRLVTALSCSPVWRAVQLPRLLASPRNTAVALCFGEERYERLEYLQRTGRDRAMGFKEALSLDDADFVDLFPEYHDWRRGQGR